MNMTLAIFGLFIVIFFLFPYIVLLSFGHYLQKYSNKRGLKWLIKFKPILDAYYAPFSKNTRYWVGFLLFIRTSLSISYSTLKKRDNTIFFVIMCFVFIGIALIPWLQNQRYEKNIVNVLGGSFILNIIILIILSIEMTNVTQEDKYHQLIIFYISIGIAFITLLGILPCHNWHRLNLKLLFRKYF